MGFLRRTVKKFDYHPRYLKGEGNPYEISHKFDAFRTTVGNNKGIKAKLNDAFEEFKSPDETGSKKTILIISAILILVFFFVIDFDLSIFFD
jgi:hypothetical protein